MSVDKICFSYNLLVSFVLYYINTGIWYYLVYISIESKFDIRKILNRIFYYCFLGIINLSNLMLGLIMFCSVCLFLYVFPWCMGIKIRIFLLGRLHYLYRNGIRSVGAFLPDLHCFYLVIMCSFNSG